MSRGALSRLQAALVREVREAECALARLFRALAKGESVKGTEIERELARVQACSDLSARVALRFGVEDAARAPETFASEPDPVPSVPFEDAVRELLALDPIGAESLKQAGLEVADAYAPVEDPLRGMVYPAVFALARAAEAEVALRVQERIASGMLEGEEGEKTAKAIAREWDWPETYARTVVRTNVATASSAGRFREAERVREAGIPIGFRFSCVNDSDVRRGRSKDHGENHKALDGLVARVDDPVWRQFTPPLGFQCRCVLEPVIGDEVPKAFVRVPPGAKAAPGFGMRGDLRTYGS